MDKAAIQVGPDLATVQAILQGIAYITSREDLDSDTKKLALLCLSNAMKQPDSVTITGCHIETR